MDQRTTASLLGSELTLYCLLMGLLLAGDTSLPCWAEPGADWYPDLVHGFIIPGGWDEGGEEVVLLNPTHQLDINSWDGLIAADSRTLVHY